MTVIERLNAKKIELEERLAGQNQQWGSQRKETLQHKLKKIEELITAYQSTSSPINLSETEEVLNQQVGFAEEKEKILNSLKIKDYCEQKNVKRGPLILCLLGPPGVGKTTFSQLLAQALKKEFFMVALGGMSDSSLLLGVSESSSGTEVGQLTKALTETKTHDPLILLDEIDKVSSYKGNSAIHSCLNAVLDPVQNKEIPDYYLDVKLDFSRDADDCQITRLNQNNFEITSEALETLINKTKEKGVRQLEKALDNIFDYCLLQWAQEASEGEPESKIVIGSDLIHKIIPHDFYNVDLVDDQEKASKNKDEKRELENLRRELATLRGEKNNQTELKAIRFNSLLVLRQVRGQFTEKEYQDYEGRINAAASREEVEVVVKEFLLKTKQKNASSKPTKENWDKEIHDELTRNKDLIKILEGKFKLFDDEIKKLKGEIQSSRERENKDKTLLVVVIIISTI
ncbi:12242_t:CDS:2 [Ambispora leptoticha]|uniref:12242_t:CDS:1 n=1 Tax=Ambispora leptoticha TaxID=144679 RepID=A0A9N9I025_9GLOM|nr:12242_t:CDS:2 [Ambispora leptoticha]